MRHTGTPPATNAVTPPTSRVEAAVKFPKIAEKLNNLKAFRIPSRESNGSPMDGLAGVNAFHIWAQRFESERAKA
jgi:hypothetical protein